MKTTMRQFDALTAFNGFITRTQLKVMTSGCMGEEGDFFRAKLTEYGERIATMPVTYAQDGMGDQAIAYLHYFTPSADCWITERDIGAPTDLVKGEQRQAFGLADLGYGPELGYISIAEWLESGAELDIHFTPCTLASLAADRQAAEEFEAA